MKVSPMRGDKTFAASPPEMSATLQSPKGLSLCRSAVNHVLGLNRGLPGRNNECNEMMENQIVHTYRAKDTKKFRSLRAANTITLALVLGLMFICYITGRLLTFKLSH